MTLFPDNEARAAINETSAVLAKCATVIATIADGEKKMNERFIILFEQLANNQILLANSVSALDQRLRVLEGRPS